MQDESEFTKLMKAFFIRYSEHTHFPIVADPPTINAATFPEMIKTYHGKVRMEERITDENIEFFKNALQSTVTRCFYDISTKIFVVKSGEETLCYHFSRDLQNLIKTTPLTFQERRNRVEYPDYETAFDDANKALAVLKSSETPVPEDFTKQVTMNKTYFFNDYKTLIIIPKELSRPCWQLIFNNDWTILITLIPKNSHFRGLLERFKKGELKKTPYIQVNKKRLPVEWFPQVVAEEPIKKQITCPKCGQVFEKAGQLTTHKKTHKLKYLSIDEMYKQKYLKYKMKYLKLKSLNYM